MRKKLEIGCELEGGLVDSTGRPVNTMRALGAEEFKLPGAPKFERLTVELGEHIVELNTGVCKNGHEIGESLRRCVGYLPAGLSPRLLTRPFDGPMPVTPKPRYHMIAQALADNEHPNGAACFTTVAPWCCTQYHIGGIEVNSPAAVLLLNFLNNIGPYARLAVIERFGVLGAEGHLGIWQGWSGPDRVPGWRWFANVDALHGFVGSISKLFTKQGDTWMSAYGTPSKIGDPEAEGTLWWLGRLRGVLKTIEWRCFPSLPIEAAAELADEVLHLVAQFWAYVDRVGMYANWESPERAIELYQSISSWLVPEGPLSAAVWWELYDR